MTSPIHFLSKSLLFAFAIFQFFSVDVHAQDEGCVFLEGLNIPCFSGGSSCGTCEDFFSETEMDDACRGTLETRNTGECRNTTCGRKCCGTCEDIDPSRYYTCQSLPNACGESCGKGTKELTCDDPNVVREAANKCGTFAPRPCGGITCQGTIEKIKCFKWENETIQSKTCKCRNVGGSGGYCSGTALPGAECDAANPCNSQGSSSACNATSNRCWSCNWTPGTPGTNVASCGVNSRFCSKNPIEVEVCPSAVGGCPAGHTATAEAPPSNRPLCSETTLPPSNCTQNSDCSCN
ncbi:MAG: hypothetical protein AB8E15_13655 [Bdellovibrionales bacterium]